jgi:hypothetical protein
MQIKEIVTESLSRVAFHYTNNKTALSILNSGVFQLSSTLGSVEQQYAPKGHPYFLSTTRTRRGGYHDIIGQQATLFVLDGDWFNRHYISRPIDYWENRDPTKSHHRAHEAEDRVFSKEPTISIDGVTAVHMYCEPEADPEVKAWTRQALISAKRNGIAAYFYTDKNAWRNFDTKKQGNINLLKGQERTGGYISRHRGYLMPWIELLQAKDKSQLSKRADQIRYNLAYTYDKAEAASSLSTDLSNARKPNSGADRANAVKLIKFMQQNGLATVKDLVDALANKWKNQTVKEARLPKNRWQLIVSNSDKEELGTELVDLVHRAYSMTSYGSFVNSLKEVIPSDWHVIDWDEDPDVDSTVFYRYARPGENWKGIKIQGIGHDGSRTSKDKAIAKVQGMLSEQGTWIESSDAMRRVLLRLNVNTIDNEQFLQMLFNDPKLKMIGNDTYARTLPSGAEITETVFGRPTLN